MKNMSRRSFLKGSVAASAGLFAAANGMAIAAAENTGITYADTIKWDAEYDVVVMGMGAAGMCAAKSAADNGATVLIAEKMSEALSGGNTKVCGQLFAYSNGDKEAAKTYYHALAAGREISDAIVDVISEGVANMADTVANEFGFDKAEYVDWTGQEVGGINMGALSPEYPEMPGSEKMSLVSTHAGLSDGRLYQGFKKAVLDRSDKIDIWYESPAVKILQDPVSKIVVGVQVERQGVAMNVRALNGVVIATGGFEANKDMMQQYLNLINYAARGGQYNTGDGIRMAQEVGADLWHMTCFEGLYAMGSTTWPAEIGTPCAQPATLMRNALNSGAMIEVGTDGNRFVNESEIGRHGHYYENGIWQNPVYPEKVWLIYDKAQFEQVKEGNLLGEEQLAAIIEAATIEELAEKTGCKPEMLKATIEAYNGYAETGIDLKCGREAQFMRAFDGEMYYALRVYAAVLNTQGGPRRNEKAEIIDVKGNPIPHLYGAGECGGITVCMYQGGTNIAECITFGTIAGKNAAATKEALPLYAVGTAVESTPVKQGEITDVVITNEFEAGHNQYIGTAAGLIGDVTVRITMDSGKIVACEVLAQNETEGIGTNAIDALPGLFLGCATAEEIDAVDSVSGATVTSNALKTAVKAALEQAK